MNKYTEKNNKKTNEIVKNISRPDYIASNNTDATKSKEKSFDFDSFYIEFAKLYPGNKLPDDTFLQWFIGFSEGEGSFCVAKRGDLSFVVTQSTDDINVLNYIKNNIGFGKVIVQSIKNKTHRYVVQDRNNINLICKLFNGNMVFPTRNARFTTFLCSFNEKLIKSNIKPLPVIYTCVIPSLNDAWLAGITDGEGCFTSSILSNGLAYRIRYILTQKWETNKSVLLDILNLYNTTKPIGTIEPHSISNVWEIRINGVKNCKILLPYFSKYSLQTKKKIAYDKWKQLLIRLEKGEHLSEVTRPLLKELSKKINKK